MTNPGHHHRRALHRRRQRRAGARYKITQVHGAYVYHGNFESRVHPQGPQGPRDSSRARFDGMMIAAAHLRTTGRRSCTKIGRYQHVDLFNPSDIPDAISGVRPKRYGSGQNVLDWIYRVDCRHHSGKRCDRRDKSDRSR